MSRQIPSEGALRSCIKPPPIAMAAVMGREMKINPLIIGRVMHSPVCFLCLVQSGCVLSDSEKFLPNTVMGKEEVSPWHS